MFVSISRKIWACIMVGVFYLRDTGVKQMHSTAKLPPLPVRSILSEAMIQEIRQGKAKKQDKRECAGLCLTVKNASLSILWQECTQRAAPFIRAKGIHQKEDSLCGPVKTKQT